MNFLDKTFLSCIACLCVIDLAQNAFAESTNATTECTYKWLQDNYGGKPVWADIDWRPKSFPRELKLAFESSHFDVQPVGSTFGLNLCHVLSWEDIRSNLDCLFQTAFDKESEGHFSINYRPIDNFLQDLFTPDNNAQVNYGNWFPPVYEDQWTNKGGRWYEQGFHQRKFYPDTNLDKGEYINPELQKLAKTYYYQQVLESRYALNFYQEHEPGVNDLNDIKHKNYLAIKNILKYANACPINLRLGDGRSNKPVGKYFDPMGNNLGIITQKECYMMNNYLISKRDPVPFDGNYYLQSSTGGDLHRNVENWYIKCIPDAGPSCYRREDCPRIK